MSDITLTMIKPEAVTDGFSGPIIKMIEDAGFSIIGMKMTRLTIERAGQFYAVHQGKPFYNSLCEYMSSGKIIAMVLKKENAISDFRKLIGATNPDDAEDGTVRKLYAKSLQSNAVHGSDSDENARIEAGFFFSDLELFA
ncbi:nucleoside-diphosphate kinase [Bacteroidota bacterium]